jgi:hypothetical protein
MEKIRLIGTNSTNKEGAEYIKYLYKHLKQHNIFNRIQTLLDETYDEHNEPERIMMELNKIDKEITTTMLRAEKKCCSKKDKALWTPELRQSNLLIQFWNIKLKAKRQGISVQRRLNKIRNLMTKATIKIIDNNKLSLNKAMTEALSNHAIMLQDNYNQRREYLLQRIKDLSERDEHSRISLVQLINREQTRADFSYLRKIFKPNKSKGITTIEVPDPDHEGQYIQISEVGQMQEYLFTRNINHFSQAELTPFTTSPLLDLFDYNGTNEESRKILEGNLENVQLEDLSDATKQILKMLGEKRNIPKIPADISFDEYIKAFDKWRERTTTSPSGHHLGHYKILLKLSVMDEENENVNISKLLLKLYYQITIIATRLGHTLERWAVVSTCMIEKIVGNSRIDKLRVIHLFEADYNLILKIIWSRRAVWHAHCCDVINHGQSGSRPGRRAIDVVIMKEMKYQYARFTKTNLGTIDNDAKSCYDRIICNVAMLISQYYGIPRELCNLQAENLRKTKFYIRTGLGESKNITHTQKIHQSMAQDRGAVLALLYGY